MSTTDETGMTFDKLVDLVKGALAKQSTVTGSGASALADVAGQDDGDTCPPVKKCTDGCKPACETGIL